MFEIETEDDAIESRIRAALAKLESDMEKLKLSQRYLEHELLLRSE